MLSREGATIVITKTATARLEDKPVNATKTVKNRVVTSALNSLPLPSMQNHMRNSGEAFRFSWNEEAPT
jgi:hypothetical protein